MSINCSLSVLKSMPETVSQHMSAVCSLLEVKQTERDYNVYEIPEYPTDVFLICASLLDASGAYGHFDPAPDNCANLHPPTFGLLSQTRDRVARLGRDWGNSEDTGSGIAPPKRLKLLWDWLSAHHGGEIVREKKGFKMLPRWWKIALLLLVAADEACVGMEQAPSRSGKKMRDRLWFNAIGKVRFSDENGIDTPENFKKSNGSAATFSVSGLKEKRNVFPKCLISENGCSHRNFTRNVTLIPNTGTVRCHWHGQQSPLKDDNEEPLNILLIPFPYQFSAKTFRPLNEKHRAEGSLSGKNARSWANFSIDQNNFKGRGALVDLVENLVSKAKDEVGTLNGIVLPELAADFTVHRDLGNRIKHNIETNLEFIVSGSQNNCDDELGNTVLTSVWSALDEDYGRGSASALISSRRKHHRWQLQASQIRAYGLSSSLDPRISWWEDHVVGFRELHFYPLRKNSIFTSMICEDLARIDPCHEVLRSVGPNLIFSLLMDGPQIESRWSARYAKTLSEDPGCTVVTLTSYGLLHRTNQSGRFPLNDVIAFFSSPFENVEVSLPYKSGARAVLLNLVSERMQDQCTMDGRKKERRGWRLAGIQPIYPDAAFLNDHI